MNAAAKNKGQGDVLSQERASPEETPKPANHQDDARLPATLESALQPDLTPTVGDRAAAVARAVLGGIPIIGSGAQELFAAFVKPPLERRRQRWMHDVVDRILHIEASGEASLEDLQQNEAFVSTVVQATQAALRTHDEKKLAALHNAVSNAAGPQAPEAALQQLFISLVDQLNPWHLRILKFLDDPMGELSPHDPLRVVPLRSLITAVETILPELKGEPDLIRQLLGDLYARGLIDDPAPEVDFGKPALRSRSTSLGEQFLSFVQDPDAAAGINAQRVFS